MGNEDGGPVVSQTCLGLLGRWFGHHYEARYDITPPDMSADALDGTVNGICRVLDAASTKLYVADVCTRCGNVVNKQEAASA
jgi:hypothetical protein